MKADIYAEMYLWNRGVDALVRVPQRSDAFSICPKQRVKAFEMALGEARAGLNGDFVEATIGRERADEDRLGQHRRTRWHGMSRIPLLGYARERLVNRRKHTLHTKHMNRL